MNKTELVREIANKTQMTQKDVAAVIDVLPEVIKEAVIGGEKVAIAGFLTFDKKHVQAKSGVSRIGGVEKPWTTPEKDEVKVTLSKAYKAI